LTASGAIGHPGGLTLGRGLIMKRRIILQAGASAGERGVAKGAGAKV